MTKCSMQKKIESFSKKNESEKNEIRAFLNYLDKQGFVQDPDFPEEPFFKAYYLDYPTGFGQIGVTAGRTYTSGYHPTIYGVSLVTRANRKVSHIASYERDITEKGALEDLLKMLPTYMAMAKNISEMPSNG